MREDLIFALLYFSFERLFLMASKKICQLSFLLNNASIAIQRPLRLQNDL